MKISIRTQKELEMYNKLKDSCTEILLDDKESIEILGTILKDLRIPLLFKSNIMDTNALIKAKKNMDFKKYGYIRLEDLDLCQDVVYNFSVSTSEKKFIDYFVREFGKGIEDCISNVPMYGGLTFYELSMKFDGADDQEKAYKFIDCIYNIIDDELGKRLDKIA